MRRKRLPNTHLEPSVICLGTANFGAQIDERQAFALLDRYFELGGNFIDTAHCYADWAAPERASSERIIGRWLAARRVRDQIVLATKGAHPIIGGDGGARVTPEAIALDIDESLQALRVERVDLYWLHRDDPTKPVGPILEALEAARRAGRIGYYACSNWSPGRIAEAERHARAHGLHGFVANQLLWSLAALRPGAMGDPTMLGMDDETYAYHLATGLAAVPYSSQANGFFAGAYGPDIPHPTPPAAAGVVRRYYSETNFTRLERARALAARAGRNAGDVALAYLTSQPFATFPIVGCRTREQLDASCAAADWELTDAEREALTGERGQRVR